MGTILCYGDSNTWGVDSRSFIGGRMPDDVLWTNLLEKMTGWHVENHGQNGRQIPSSDHELIWVRKLLDDAPVKEAPVWLWIMLGTNDLLVHEDFTAEDVAARMRTFLETIREHPNVRSGCVKLRLISPPPMFSDIISGFTAVSRALDCVKLHFCLCFCTQPLLKLWFCAIFKTVRL